MVLVYTIMIPKQNFKASKQLGAYVLVYTIMIPKQNFKG